MSDIDNDETLAQDELTALKARADLMNISYHPSIGLEKLREKVNAAVAGDPAPEKTTVVAKESVEEERARLRKEANRLVRVRVTCMNPAKAEWEGEIFTCGNSVIGSLTKFVPFNVEDGWHVPTMILKQIQERQCQIFTTVRDNRGNSIRKGKLIKEFAVEIMPDLTPDELQELAQRQAMSKSVA